MRTDTPPPIRLADYRPPDWLVDAVDLQVFLDSTATRVQATLSLRPNPKGRPNAPLVLDGDELSLTGVFLDNVPLAPEQYAATPSNLTLAEPPRRPFRLRVDTLVNPSANTKLMGLYRSGATYCTQCEPEGFRRITYFPDRPDVMAVYTTRIEAEKTEAPVLLANGNLIAQGEIAGSNRHFALWRDPFPKPSYLFALVGGKLGCVEDRFRTMSGREVGLRIFVEPGKEHRCSYAMDSLKRAMRWDEVNFGREYDLDVFMIVAVGDFNMGAMENKGLNIFNDKYVLASPDTATDADFAHIEAVIAHEYFHNWTGNRITCRDWFQLCLKEGLTVFRDREFSADQRSRAVERIADVRALRAQQFVEDAGPLAHPVRPAAYHEINNFYTPTVYEKGAEIVRMLKMLLGDAGFRKGMDAYFVRCDGTAATVEDFVGCFADANAVDLSQFMRWYNQPGTPEVKVTSSFDGNARTLRVEFEQHIPPSPGYPIKEPMLIPLVFGLIGEDGRDLPLIGEDGKPLPRPVVAISKATQTLVLEEVPARPILSLNRGFAAPIKVSADRSPEELRFAAAHDSDAFNRWEALQLLATSVLVDMTAAIRSGAPPRFDRALLSALGATLSSQDLEPAFIAQALTLPTDADIAREIGENVDPDAIFTARRELRRVVGEELGTLLQTMHAHLANEAPYSPDAASAGRRALKNACLDLLAATERADVIEMAERHYESADNMTDRMAGLGILSLYDVPARSRCLADFYRRYESDPLVIDKWFGLQALIPEPATLDRVKVLTRHPAFSFANPNRIRALIGSFAHSNPTQFNRLDGAGFDFIADTVISLDQKNPQVAARLLGAFKSWRRLEPARRERAEGALKKVAAVEPLSPDVRDIVERSLN